MTRGNNLGELRAGYMKKPLTMTAGAFHLVPYC